MKKGSERVSTLFRFLFLLYNSLHYDDYVICNMCC